MKPLSEKRPTDQSVRGSETFTRTMSGMGRLIEAVTPWLLDLGSWIFGALIAFNLVILGALLTVGPVDLAVKISTAAFALALPPDIAGFVLLRLVADLSKGRVADVAMEAFAKEGFTVEGAPPRGAVAKRLRSSTLRYSYLLLSLALVLTLVGVTAALWHMGWWIGIGFVVMVVVSQGVAVLAITSLDAGGRWSTPAGEVEPEKPEQKQ